VIIEDLKQQTPEWMQMRCGSVVGSRTADVMTRLKIANTNKETGVKRNKGEYAQPHYDYLKEVAIERLTGNWRDSGIGNLKAVEWGIEQEPNARAQYELQTDLLVRPIGLAVHPKEKWFCASPDSLVGDDGLMEVKCLASGNHIEIIETDKIPEKFIPQLMAQMACAERQWCDFVAYDPRLPQNLQLFIKRLDRSDYVKFRDVTQSVDSHIADMEDEVKRFLEDVILYLGKLAEYSARFRTVTIPAHYVAPGSADDAGSAKEPSDGIGLSGRTLEDFR
jgi:YqaJ-like viral recombinase domain